MNSPWSVVAIAILLLIVTIMAGVFKPVTLAALLVFVILGMIFPPVAIWVGAIMLLYLLMVHGVNVASNVTSKVNGAGA